LKELHERHLQEKFVKDNCIPLKGRMFQYIRIQE
jgi:hypothetical protein